MHHIEIYVSKLNESRKFYSWLLEWLGFHLYQDWEEGFSYRKDSFYVVFVQTKSPYLQNGYHRCNTGLNHLAFRCSEKDTIELIRAELIQRGIPLLYDEKYPYAGGVGHYALYFEDPDRIKLEIVLCESPMVSGREK